MALHAKRVPVALGWPGRALRKAISLPADRATTGAATGRQSGKEWIVSSRRPGIEKRLVSIAHHTGETVEMPVAVITGARTGPTFAITAGMHGGEYSAVLAAQRVIQQVRPDELSGRLIVVPVISTRWKRRA